MKQVWFIWSIIILVIWLVIYLTRISYRREMLKISLVTMLFGLTEPLFVPAYWNLEALTKILILGIPLLFAFSFGMYWSSLYEHITWRKLINHQ